MDDKATRWQGDKVKDERAGELRAPRSPCHLVTPSPCHPPHFGVGTRSRIACRIVVVPLASPLCRYVLLTTRWAQHGTNRVLTSSGVTYSRPATRADAWAACVSARAPRGDTPRCRSSLSRVAATRSRMYSTSDASRRTFG